MSETVEKIPVHTIWSDADFNCRGSLTPLDYLHIADDMAINGQIQPIVVRPLVGKPGYDYQIVVGHCRHAAAKHLKWVTIDAIIRNLPGDAGVLTNISENFKRRELTMSQEAKSVRQLLSIGRTRDQICSILGRERSWVDGRVDFLNLPKEIQEDADAGFFSEKEIRKISRQVGTHAKFELVRQIKTRKERLGKAIDRFDPLEGKRVRNEATNRVRTKGEIMDKINLVLSVFGTCHISRVMAWCAGGISTSDLYNELESFAESKGVTFQRPTNES